VVLLCSSLSLGEIQDVYVEALQAVLASSCDWSALTTTFAARALAATATAHVEKRIIDINYACELALDNMLNMLAAPDSGAGQNLAIGYNSVMNSAGFSYLVATRIILGPTGISYSAMASPLQTSWVEEVLDAPEALDEALGEEEELPICIYWWKPDP